MRYLSLVILLFFSLCTPTALAAGWDITTLGGVGTPSDGRIWYGELAALYEVAPNVSLGPSVGYENVSKDWHRPGTKTRRYWSDASFGGQGHAGVFGLLGTYTHTLRPEDYILERIPLYAIAGIHYHALDGQMWEQSRRGYTPYWWGKPWVRTEQRTYDLSGRWTARLGGGLGFVLSENVELMLAVSYQWQFSSGPEGRILEGALLQIGPRISLD